jgi:glycosyltransferase involved in cell wall biosynthesis
MLLDAFFMVHEKHPDYVLRIYGNDSGDGTKEILEKKIEEAGAKDYVFLMGGSEHLEEDLPKGSIYAFSSDWEGLPNSLMEAMALGMPVVATDCPCGGPAEIIRSAHMDGDVPETAYQYRSSYSNYSSKGDSVNAGRRARGGKEWPKGNGDLETANGILTPIRNPEAFAAAICRLIENPELARELAKSAAKIAERANEQAVFEQWRDYLERISSKK